MFSFAGTGALPALFVGMPEALAQLRAGTVSLELVQACQDDWCHVRSPGHEGWVYSGKDYDSLGRHQ